MRQYQQFKAEHPDYILFFRMGDFYEMFWEDARTAARVLGVTLTSRSRGGLNAEDAIPMAGVPFHSVDGYLRRMIVAGYKVALCEQVENPDEAKGVIRREVVRLMTPGTLTEDQLLDTQSDNYLTSIAFELTRGRGFRTGLAWVELSTGAVVAMSGSEGEVMDELARLDPAEVLVPQLPDGQPHPIAAKIEQMKRSVMTPRPDWQFTLHHAAEQLNKQWGVTTAAGFGFEADDPALIAIGAALSYLHETQRDSVGHLRPPRRHLPEQFLAIDPSSWRSLEIDRTVRTGQTAGSLLSVIDRTSTAMGARMLRQWIRFPLYDREYIEARQATIASLLEDVTTLQAIAGDLRNVCDIERIVARLSVGRAGPRDLSALGRCLAALPTLLDRLQTMGLHDSIVPELTAMREFIASQADYLNSAIADDPAAHLREGGVIADGFDAELDRLRGIATNSRKWLADYQAQLADETQISTLRIGYNKVFGYYIEVSDAHRDKVPDGWVRKQTIKNAERYITDTLKTFEQEATSALDRSIALEQSLFEQVRQTMLPLIGPYQELADTLARLDVLCALAILAQQHRYCRPVLRDNRVLEIVDGRHPVLDQQLGNQFVSNDVRFDANDSLLLITGPNMAGKSTYIRQVALIVLLAQIGAYVPAKSATIGLVDRLFTRIGASDELHAGQSTFMVEMTETANILNNATDRSLVILDEIGRGTSTLDGLSLAWAIAEHVATVVRCRALFATHYHELTELAQRFKGVRNLNVAVKEAGEQVVFLHRIVEGGTDRSYGIHVARLAGVPRPVLDRARQLLNELSVQQVGASTKPSRFRRDQYQLTLFADPSQQVVSELLSTDLSQLSDVQAAQFVRLLQQRLK